MDRISGANYQSTALSSPVTYASGTYRTFVDLNLGTNTSGTYPNALWFTGAQESILAPVTAIGLTPTDADNTQLLKAIKTFAGGYATTISATPGGPLTIAEAGLIMVNATAGNISLTLPLAAAANGAPLRFTFIRTDGSSNTVAIALGGSDTALLFAAPLSLGADSLLAVVSDGVSQWALTENSFTGPYQSIGATGAQFLPGGLILQWGATVLSGPPAPNVVILPHRFPNNFLNAWASDSGAGCISYGCSPIDTDSFNVWYSAWAAPSAPRWLALGN